MPIITKTSGTTPGAALFYITAGALMTIWGAVWFFFFAPETRVSLGLCAGLFFSGLAFLIIGFSIGRIGREARLAEADPDEIEKTKRGPRGTEVETQV